MAARTQPVLVSNGQSSAEHTAADETFDMAAFMRAKASIDAMPKLPPMTIVHHPYMMRGKAWQMLEDGHLYAFIHSDDLAAIPTAAAGTLGYAGVPVRRFDDGMRAVFLRGLEKLASAEGTEAASPPASDPGTP